MNASKIALAALLCALIALSACRQEVPYEPIKLGGPVPQQPTR